MTIMTDTRSVFAAGNHALESTGSGRHSATLKTVIHMFCFTFVCVYYDTHVSACIFMCV